jgi:hypothetical protein
MSKGSAGFLDRFHRKPMEFTGSGLKVSAICPPEIPRNSTFAGWHFKISSIFRGNAAVVVAHFLVESAKQIVYYLPCKYEPHSGKPGGIPS